MEHNSTKETNRVTKEAWHDNWQAIDIETILGIFEYPRVNKLLEVITDNLPEGGCLLEAGCGLGPWVIKFRELGYDILGIDYDEKCIRKIKEYDNRQEVYMADIRQIPFDDGFFDAYLSFGVIEHFAEGPDKALMEAYRILKDGGKLVLSVPYFNETLENPRT